MIDPRGISMTNEGVFIKCSMCGKVERLNLTTQEYGDLYFAIDTGIGLIQEILPDRTPAERELCCSNFCYDCQKKIFGNPKDRAIKELRKKNSEEAYKEMHKDDGATEGTLYLIRQTGTVEKLEKKGRASYLVSDALGFKWMTATKVKPEQTEQLYFMLTDEDADTRMDVKINRIASNLMGYDVRGDAALVKYYDDIDENFSLLASSEVEELETKFDCLRKEVA